MSKHKKRNEKEKKSTKRYIKKDTGVAVVAAKMSDGRTVKFRMREEIRDAYNKRPHHSEFKHGAALELNPDYMTQQDLEKYRFSGFRNNTLTNNAELWVLGKIHATERADRVARNPGLLADMHERVFSTIGTIVDVDIPVFNQDPDAPRPEPKDIN